MFLFVWAYRLDLYARPLRQRTSGHGIWFRWAFAPSERVSRTRSLCMSLSARTALGCPSTRFRGPRFRGASLRLSAPSSRLLSSRLPCRPAVAAAEPVLLVLDRLSPRQLSSCLNAFSAFAASDFCRSFLSDARHSFCNRVQNGSAFSYFLFVHAVYLCLQVSGHTESRQRSTAHTDKGMQIEEQCRVLCLDRVGRPSKRLQRVQ